MFTANYIYNLILAKTSIAFQHDQECLHIYFFEYNEYNGMLAHEVKLK